MRFGTQATRGGSDVQRGRPERRRAAHHAAEVAGSCSSRGRASGCVRLLSPFEPGRSSARRSHRAGDAPLRAVPARTAFRTAPCLARLDVSRGARAGSTRARSSTCFGRPDADSAGQLPTLPRRRARIRSRCGRRRPARDHRSNRTRSCGLLAPASRRNGAGAIHADFSTENDLTRRFVMNKGTAIVGFLLSFIAGMFLMWGIDRARAARSRPKARAAAGAFDHSAASVPVTSKDPHLGQGRRAGHHRRDQRLRVPVLQPRRTDASSRSRRPTDRQGPHRLEEQAAAVPQERARRARSGRDRAWARRQRRILEVPRLRVREPEGPHRRKLREVGGRRGRRPGEVQGRPTARRSTPRRSTRTWRSRRRSARAARRRSASTA